jgi:hypothetical protein
MAPVGDRAANEKASVQVQPQSAAHIEKAIALYDEALRGR